MLAHPAKMLGKIKMGKSMTRSEAKLSWSYDSVWSKEVAQISCQVSRMFMLVHNMNHER
jgi:hypothetical protein